MAERICPHCRKPIYDDDALLCLYCGESLQHDRFFIKPKIIFLLIAVILIVSFIAMMVR
ncbi:MAG TPA: zinc-ribbon domain-containing protein [Candidatus Omnitrophota bacterium]|nr:zinc-ribbon domain-containing protein [Candidatus Omnitrophota bacterium]HRZ14370.1 zinc-ribbon domain-containing protein [Candidatus Omnitrophota bacterium]